MRVFGLNRQFSWVSRREWVELTGKQQDRLRALKLWQETGNARLACRTFALSQASLYRWRKRFDPHDLSSLEDLSRKPRRLRQPKWTALLKQAVKRLRERYPRWGKNKLAVLLRAEGIEATPSTIGRILRYLKQRGELVELKTKAISAQRRQRKRPYAVRKPKEYRPQSPGDLVELDTLDIRPAAGVILKQFTARDVISRWDVIEVHHQATASLAASFLDTLEARMPFKIRAAQVDGGSEFFAQFEVQCQKKGIELFVLPPKSPKLNGAVERANRTHTEEFYEVYECHWSVETLNPQLRHWEAIYNTVRPHQSLKYLTPLQFLKLKGIVPKNYPSLSHM